MANAAEALPTADCEVVDTKTTAKNDPVQLCMFMEPLSAVETLQRTTRYAQDPKRYLQTTLGDSVFESRKAVLCLPEPEDVNLDAYGTGTHKQHFEKHIAKLLNKDHGLFFLTGVQAQLIAMKIYSLRSGRQKIAWHVSSHLESAEELAYEHLYGLERILLGQDPEALPSVDEIKSVLDLPEPDRPAAVLLEIPNRVLGCKTYSYVELQRISLACRAAGVALHCDGARLWEIEPYYRATASVSFAEIGALFDSVYVSFYKGLRGVTGAMLVHNDASFIAEAKKWQRRAGGNAFTLGYQVIDCERGFNEMIGTFSRKRDKMIRIVDAISAATLQFKTFKTSKGAQVISFVPEKAACSQILTRFQGFAESELLAARDRVQERSGVRVFERLRPKQTLDEKLAEDRLVDVKAKEGSQKTDEQTDRTERAENRTYFMEWMLMSVTERLDDSVFVDGYVALCEELVDGTK